MASLRIDDAAFEHLEGVAAIYDEVVESSPATFDIEPPGVEPWRRVLETAEAAAGHLLIVAVDETDRVLGWAKSGRFRDRAAYDTTCETSVYVASEARGRGVGRELYAALLPRLEASPLRLATAGLTEPNQASTALHLAFGFERVGTFEGVGVKFGRPWSVTWYQRPLVQRRGSLRASPAGGP